MILNTNELQSGERRLVKHPLTKLVENMFCIL